MGKSKAIWSVGGRGGQGGKGAFSGSLFSAAPFLVWLPLAQVSPPGPTPPSPAPRAPTVNLESTGSFSRSPDKVAPLGSRVAPPSTQTRATEVRVPPAAAGDDVPAEPRVHAVPAEQRDATKAQLPQLRNCRVTVASERNARNVLMGDLLLRFTIQANGSVSDAEVLAQGPTDPDVLTCVRTRLEQFRYAPAPASDLRVEYRMPARR